jgi:GLPGLI family protein
LKEVAGHLCMNASWVDTVKQQKIIAWFALDIPHQGGPERYCGLPGMILEIDVNDGAMNVSANRIESKKLTSELDPPKKAKGKKSSEADYQKALHKVVQESIKEEEPYFWRIRY